jgi:hypothetical protein
MGGYSEWGDWTDCTAKCGGGEQVRSRTCTNPVPEFGGNDCTLIGESLEKRECNKIPCPGTVELRCVVVNRLWAEIISMFRTKWTNSTLWLKLYLKKAPKIALL